MKILAVLQALDMHRLRGTPKDVYEQIGISERGKVGAQSWLQTVKCWIGKCFAYNNSLSD